MYLSIMEIGGLEFPIRKKYPEESHTGLMSVVIRLHPLAMWIPIAIVGGLLGWFTR